MTRHLSLLILAAAAVTGCRSTLPPPPPQVSIPAVDVQPLVGEWRGDYIADGPGDRHGSLSFGLVAGNNDAHGSLSMNAAGADRAYARYRSEQAVVTSADTTAGPELPAIQFVRLGRSNVSGTIDAYVDPDCQCAAVMTLKGDLQGDTIDGTFRATYDGRKPDLTGKWSVKRAATR